MNPKLFALLVKMFGPPPPDKILEVADGIPVKGALRAQEWDAKLYPTYASIKAAQAKGIKPIRSQEVKNLVVTLGKNWIADKCFDDKTTTLEFCGVGSGTTTPTIGDTDLETAIGARKTNTNRFRTNNITTITTFYASGDNNGTWEEAILAMASSGGDIFSHALFPSTITKTTAITVTIDWDITWG